MQITRLAAEADNRGDPVDNGGVRLTYHEDGQLLEETRRYLLDGTVRVTIKNVISGAETTNVVAAGELEPV